MEDLDFNTLLLLPTSGHGFPPHAREEVACPRRRLLFYRPLTWLVLQVSTLAVFYNPIRVRDFVK